MKIAQADFNNNIFLQEYANYIFEDDNRSPNAI